MNLINTLWRPLAGERKRRLSRAEAALAASLRSPAPAAEVRPEAGACGWFDSSHALHQGLRVTEHDSPQTVANEVPLGWWLDWQLNAPPALAPQPLHAAAAIP